MYLLIKITLLLYAAACTLLTFVQIENSTRKIEWSKSDQVCSVFINLVIAGLFLFIYLKGYIIINQWFLLVIAIHHFIRAIYNIYNCPEIQEWSMTAIYINMITYAMTVYGMVFLWGL